MSRKLLKSTAVVSAMTFLSRILGFVRDMVFAAIFGASAGMDAFIVAFKIPNFLRRLFAEGAFAQSFVPVLTEVKETQSPEAVRKLVAQVSGTLGAILLLVSTIGMLAAPLFVAGFAPKWFIDGSDKYVMASDMLRITFPYIFFISLVALAGGALNSHGRFAIPALTPIWLNISFLAMAFWGVDYFAQPIHALAWGVFIAGAAQLLFQFPSLWSLRLLTWPVWAWRSPQVQKILKLMVPIIIGSSVAQISLILDTIFASMLQTGSVSWLYFSDRLMEFPLGIFAIALSTVVLPSLSRHNASGSMDDFNRELNWAIRVALLIAVPAAAALIVLSGPLLATLFQHGDFSPRDVEMSQWSLIAYGVGLLGFSLVKVLTPGFYARQDTKTPVKIAMIALLVGMLANAAYVLPMLYFDFVAPHMGLAAATATLAFTNAFLLYRGLRRQNIFTALPGLGRYLLQLLLATAAMVALLLWLQGPLDGWFAATISQRVSLLTLCVLGGVAVYFVTLFATGWRLSHIRH